MLINPQERPVMLASFAVAVGLFFTTSGFIYSLRYMYLQLFHFLFCLKTDFFEALNVIGLTSA